MIRFTAGFRNRGNPGKESGSPHEGEERLLRIGRIGIVKRIIISKRIKDMAKIVTLGEIMLRLSPEGNKRFVQVDSFDAIWGGGEANVAVSCANYGLNACFVSKLPTHEIGRASCRERV